MEILLYLLMFMIGYVGMVIILHNNDIHRYFIYAFVLCFVLLANFHIDGAAELKDLEFYIHYYVHDYDSYFEIGYVLLTRIVKFFFGHNPYVFISIFALLIFLLVVAAARICSFYLEKDEATYLPMNNLSRSFCLFYFVCFYWGCFFVSMTLRVGLATAMLYSATAFAINKKMFYCYLVAAASVFFHSSCIVYILGVSVLLFVKNVTAKQFYIWFSIIVISRFVLGYAFPLGKLLLNLVMNFDIFSHYFEYILTPQSSEAVSYAPSLQDLLYCIIGFLMIKGNLSNRTYNRSVVIYFMGLTMGMIFQGSSISMRLQWIFLSMMIFPLLLFFLDRNYSMKTKLAVVFSYAVLEQIMAIRQFGWFILV